MSDFQRDLHDPREITCIMRLILTILIFLPCVLYSQEEDFFPIHQEQKEYYARFEGQDARFFDSLNSFHGKVHWSDDDTCRLEKLVFGFHPFWMGSAYLNYRWNLLSDICYFSYEVDPASGDPVTFHGWLTDPAIDSAQAHGVRTHLCATLFSGHFTFFADPVAQQKLMDNLISLVLQRNADGINIDFEAVPGSLRPQVTGFMLELSEQFHAAMPDGILSIDLPAVDWGEVFDVNAMKDHVDLFFVMGYDYYWNGSGTAGPVGPLYSMTNIYDHSLCRTISNYQTTGVPEEKFLLGLPYYGRLWNTLSGTVPSGTIGYGSALTYANVRNNSGGNFSPLNYFWEGNSFSSCYIYFENDTWNQCFIGLDRDLRERYDLVNYRRLAGIGIWALGYDNGYEELWDAIRDRFTDCSTELPADTLYDCGGPAWDYYNNEEYLLYLNLVDAETRYLDFRSFFTEQGFDSLWVYSGPDSALTLLGALSGQVSPPLYTSDDGRYLLRFRSDGLSTESGWEAIWHDGTLGVSEERKKMPVIMAEPNPFRKDVTLHIAGCKCNDVILECRDIAGRKIPVVIRSCQEDPGEIRVQASINVATARSRGIYFLSIWSNSKFVGVVKLISHR